MSFNKKKKQVDKSQQQYTRKIKHSNENSKIAPKDEAFLIDLLRTKKDPLVLVLDCVQDPHNLGACLRTCDGAGVDAVIVPKDNAVSLTPAVINVACGAAESVPLIRVTNLSRTLKNLQKEGLWLVGTSDATDKNIYDIDLTGPIGIVMGAEGKGMRRLTMENCDFLVKIPMQGSVPCLNVSVATGVCVYESLRQRQVKAAEALAALEL